MTPPVPHSPSGSTLQALPDFGTWVGHPYKNNKQSVMTTRMQKFKRRLRRPMRGATYINKCKTQKSANVLNNMSGASAQESVQRNGTLGPTAGKRGRLPKRGARGGTYRPVSNGPVAEQAGGEPDLPHGPRPVAWPSARSGAPVNQGRGGCPRTRSQQARGKRHMV